MPCGLHLHCCFWEGKMTPRLPNTHVVCFFCFLISLLKTPLSPVSSGVRLLIILQDLLFIPQNLSHPSKLIMGNLVHFRYLLYAANSFLSLSLPDRSLPSYPYFNNLYKWQITFLFWTAALPLYFAVWRASFFHILPFFFLLSILTQQCKCLKISSISVLMKLFIQSLRLVHAGLSTHKGDSLPELLSGRLDGTE